MLERVARLVAMLVAVMGVLLLMAAAMASDVQPDADAYWLAAQRLRDGLPLYAMQGTDETEIYRYAPWFAFAWVPLTYLPQAIAFDVWRVVLLVATLAAVWPLIRRPSPAGLTLAVLLGGLLLTNLPAANVTPLLVGLLSIGIRSPAGPLLVGVAASLKLFPVLFVAGYLAERRWVAAAGAIGVAAILWLTVLAFDLGAYLRLGGPGFFVGGVSLFGVSPLLWLPVAAGILLLTAWLAIARSRWTWLSAAASIPLAVPRVWLPEAAYLLVGANTALSAGAATATEPEPATDPAAVGRGGDAG